MAGNAFLRTFGKHWMKPLTLIALVIPFVYIAWPFWQVWTGADPYALGINPVQTTHRYLGDTAITVLLITLAISPIRDITGWAPIALIRRRVGLAAFFYAFLHLFAYLWLDRGFDLGKLWEDLNIRIYITLGMIALVLMVPLAVTSNNASIRAMGRKAWDRLHWLIYPLAIFAVAHNLLMVKTIEGEPAIHAAVLALLLLWRVGRWAMKRLKPAQAAA